MVPLQHGKIARAFGVRRRAAAFLPFPVSFVRGADEAALDEHVRTFLDGRRDVFSEPRTEHADAMPLGFRGLGADLRKRGRCGRFSVFSSCSVVTCLVQKRASVVVYVDPEIQLSIAVGKVACFVECFAVFPERSAWRCEGVDWIQSYNAILPLRCLSLHLFTSGGPSSNYRNVVITASITTPFA